MIWQLVLENLVVPVEDLFRYVVFQPDFAVVVAGTLALQAMIPARPGEKFLNAGLAQDLVWFVYEHVLHLLVVTTYVAWLSRLFSDYLIFLRIDAVADWPGALRFATGVLLLDFLYWLQHLCNHKVPGLWRFHAVHHSQRQLNFFSDYRYHVVEYLVRHTILTIPFLILHFDVPTIVAFSYFQKWYSRFYHANIRTNLGPLRYLLVTPQSHRIHHALQPEYRDTNYGALFSIWDRLFGTQVKVYDDYPETGIDDDRFPLEESARFPKLLVVPLIQMAYPLRRQGRGDDELRGAA